MDTKEIEISHTIDNKKSRSKIKYIALASIVGIVAISSVIVINLSLTIIFPLLCNYILYCV